MSVSIVLFLLCLPYICPDILGAGDELQLCKDWKSLDTLKLGGTRPHIITLTFQDVDNLPNECMNIIADV